MCTLSGPLGITTWVIFGWDGKPSHGWGFPVKSCSWDNYRYWLDVPKYLDTGSSLTVYMPDQWVWGGWIYHWWSHKKDVPFPYLDDQESKFINCWFRINHVRVLEMLHRYNCLQYLVLHRNDWICIRLCFRIMYLSMSWHRFNIVPWLTRLAMRFINSAIPGVKSKHMFLTVWTEYSTSGCTRLEKDLIEITHCSYGWSLFQLTLNGSQWKIIWISNQTILFSKIEGVIRPF